jgi:ribonuclease BN (tRNA processing enzyme)
MREAGRSDLTALLVPEEIALPASIEAGPGRVAPPMGPILVTEDDRVRVTAVLVQHAPVFPSFAYRFDTEEGSIVISGDTAPCANLVTLARDADILVYAVCDDAAGAPGEDESWEAKQRERHLLDAHTPLRAVGKVAAEAAARKLVLTHFIPGEDALPDEHWIRGASRGFDGEVIVGRDLFELRP